MGKLLTNFPRTDRVSNEPQIGLLSRKRLIRHAEVWHRCNSACELMGWLKREARGTRSVTPALSSRSRKGVKPNPLPNPAWGRGGFRVKLCHYRG